MDSHRYSIPAVLWITGLPASGKTTLAHQIHAKFESSGVRTILLDGDDLRKSLNADLGFSVEARQENVRRIGEIARLLHAQSYTVVVACISPIREQRTALRETFGKGQFVEIYMDTPVEVCRERDPKGLYRRAAAGQVREMTGVDSVYEPPLNPDFSIKPDSFDPLEFFRRFKS